MTVNEFANIYESHSAADKYIVGFLSHKALFMTILDTIPIEWLNIEKASRNQGENLRLRMKAEVRNTLAENSICVGTVESLVANTAYNKGENFEQIVTEYFGQVWVKDTVPFWVDGDITVNDIKYQIKLDSATLMNTKQVEKLSA